MGSFIRKRPRLAKYLDSLKFAFYCVAHPVDGFWDLTHEKRGTLAAANTILFLTVFVRLVSLKYTSFLIRAMNWEEVNIFLWIASIIFPLALWVLGNWGCTTLFDGKARLWQIYMATCYGMLPYPIVTTVLTIFSNGVTLEESEFYSVVNLITLVYCGILIVVSMSQIHEFKMGKNLLFTLLSIIAMLIIVFILMIFFSMIAQGIGYFVSMAKELMFRF